jgi:hypothetical protein
MAAADAGSCNVIHHIEVGDHATSFASISFSIQQKRLRRKLNSVL